MRQKQLMSCRVTILRLVALVSILDVVHVAGTIVGPARKYDTRWAREENWFWTLSRPLDARWVDWFRNPCPQKPLPIQTRQNYRSVASQNSYWRIKAQNMKVFGYRLTVQPMRPGGHAIRSSTYSSPIAFNGGGRGCHRKGWGDSQVWTPSRIPMVNPYLTIDNQSGFQINLSDWRDAMKFPRKSISGDTWTIHSKQKVTYTVTNFDPG